jgi:hypothetical protein
MMRGIAIIMALVSFSSAGCGIMDTDANVAFTQALPIIGAAIALSIAVAALAYMAGSFMRNPNLLVFSKDQIFHTFVSVLLVISIEGIFYGTCMFASSAAGSDLQSASLNYMRELRVDGGQMLAQIMKRSIEYKFEAAYYTAYQVPYMGGEAYWWEAYNNAYARNLEMLFDFVMVGYVSAGVQYNLLGMLPQIALGVMVPMGLLLRCIPKAREAGNMVMALALALYVVIPFCYAVASTMRETEVPWFTGAPDDTGISFEDAGLYLFQTIFLPNLALVVFATAVGGLMKVAKVIP